MQVEYVGLRVPVPENTMCVNHPHLEAVRGYVTSIDDGAHEYAHLCEECGIVHQISLDTFVETEEQCIGDCEWCRATNVPVFETRDIEEGSSGCIYDVCRKCIKEQNDSLAREEEVYRREHGLSLLDDESEEMYPQEDSAELDVQAEEDDVRYVDGD